MNREVVAAVIVLVLLGTVYMLVIAHADMTGCLPEGVCCPDDHPTNCHDIGWFMGGGEVCVVCEMGCAKFGCVYTYWKWDTNYDGIHDCTENCFQGYVTGGCP